MLVLTEDAGLFCKHGGHVANRPSQSLVTIMGRRVLVEDDPVGCSISACPSTIPFKPCLVTLPVQKGYSAFVRIAERRVCLDTVSGLTDGTPPGFVKYIVRYAGQALVSEQV